MGAPLMGRNPVDGYTQCHHVDVGLCEKVPDAPGVPCRHCHPTAEDADPDLVVMVHFTLPKLR